MNRVADPDAIVLQASLRRFSLLAPAIILSGMTAGLVIASILTALGVIRGPGFPAGAGSAMFLALLIAYARLTRLTIDADGIELTQPFSRRNARWDEIVSLYVRSYLEPTHRGGVASGIRIRLARQDKPFDIPDLFTPKRELAALISARWTAYRYAISSTGR